MGTSKNLAGRKVLVSAFPQNPIKFIDWPTTLWTSLERKQKIITMTISAT